MTTGRADDARVLTRWATRILTLPNPDHDSLKEGLLRHCYALESAGTEASTVALAAKGNLFESKFNFFQHPEPAVQKLREFCLAAVHQAAAMANLGIWDPADRVQVAATESWCHITRDGGYHDVHAHPMCSWCGIYYVEPGETDAATANGANRFYEPRLNATMYADHATQYLYRESSIDVPAREGHAVIFPSYLRHAALPYRGTRDRVVVAFNTRTLRAPD